MIYTIPIKLSHRFYERSDRNCSIDTKALLRVSILLVVVHFHTGSLHASAIPRPSSQKSSQEAPSQTLTLKVGGVVNRELGGGQKDSYQLEVTADSFVHVVVEQLGIDVILTIYDPGGTKVCEVDRPNSSHGREAISIIASET